MTAEVIDMAAWRGAAKAETSPVAGRSLAVRQLLDAIQRRLSAGEAGVLDAAAWLALVWCLLRLLDEMGLAALR
jgi:hypothetical protein